MVLNYYWPTNEFKLFSVLVSDKLFEMKLLIYLLLTSGAQVLFLAIKLDAN